MKFIDTLLDKITMYQLLLYYLLMLVGAAMVLSAFGVLSYNPISIALSAGYITFVCWVVNRIFAYLFRVPVNPESALLTGLILSLIITPLASGQNIVFLSAAGGLAIASKYLLTIRHKHIFNPVAIALVLTSFGAGDSASWWVGSAQLAPFVLVGGLILARKIQHTKMIAVYFATIAAVTAGIALAGKADVLAALQTTLFHSSALFLGFVMLTEPLTSPTDKRKQTWYALLTGALFAPQVHLFNIYSTPELSLAIGNIFSAIVNPKTRFMPRLIGQTKWGAQTIDFAFAADRPLKYQPGQYIEMTLPHRKPDDRGSRRYFTLASSPTESDLHIGVKFYPEGSTFKRAMHAMSATTSVAIEQVAGDFTLPADRTRKLAFIAGGIGVTPFRSMVKYLIDTDDHRAVSLLYAERQVNELAYTDVFEQARRQLGTAVTYVVTSQTDNVPAGVATGHIDAAMIRRALPDYAERLFYISGPHRMVTDTKRLLLAMGVPRKNIKIDFFPGYGQ
jgi:ferredoxin-NADP reductase/Na+-translocating ferredoxin:NAD+ oxidoreductase RnfD subunit